MASDDVTIPRETAKRWAAFLRASAQDRLNPDWRPLADLLDPPLPSLLDEVASVIGPLVADMFTARVYAEAVLARAREHIEAMPERAYRDDVLALLGGDDE